MTDLINKKCIPCEVGGNPLEAEVANGLLREVPTWNISSDNKKISKKYVFKNFIENMAFVNKAAELAESEGHHPDLDISYNKLNIELSTHAIGGLSENDFILAAKIDRL